MDFPSDQTLNEKERTNLVKASLVKTTHDPSVAQGMLKSLHNNHSGLVKASLASQTANTSENISKAEPELITSDSPTGGNHSEQHSQAENTEINSTLKLEHNRLLCDYRSLLQSYNTLSQAFHSHVNRLQPSVFSEQLSALKADNEKYKNESQGYIEEIQRLVLENQLLRNGKEISLSNHYEEYTNTADFSDRQTFRGEFKGKQAEEARRLRNDAQMLEDVKREHEDLLQRNSELLSEVQKVKEAKALLEKEIETLIETAKKKESLLDLIKLHRDLLLSKEKHLGGTQAKEVETFEVRIRSLEDKLRGGNDDARYQVKCEAFSEKLKKSEVMCKEMLEKVKKYKKRCEMLEVDKKHSDECLAESKKILKSIQEEMEGARRAQLVTNPKSLVKLVYLLHKSNRVTVGSL